MQFPTYLLTSAIGGGVLGAVHGAASGFLELRQQQQQLSLKDAGEYMVPRIAHHGITGALLGPWFPVVVPLYYFAWKDRRCPQLEIFSRYK